MLTIQVIFGIIINKNSMKNFSIDWLTVINENIGMEGSYPDFYDKVEDTLNHMTPYWKITQRKVRLAQRLWITRQAV